MKPLFIAIGFLAVADFAILSVDFALAIAILLR